MAMASNRDLVAGVVLVAAACVVASGVVVSGSAQADGNARGEDLYRLCAACHGVDAAGNEAVGAPAIAALPQWYVGAQLKQFRDGIRGTHFDDIMGMRMRPMSLTLRSDADVEAVAAFVAGMPVVHPPPSLTGGDAAKGKETYVATCVACHGADGVGNQAMMGAAPLVHASDWYLLRQVENFRAGIRGARPGDQGGALMRPMVLRLADEQAIKDVVAYIMTLAN